MAENFWIKFCAGCWMCKFTRSCAKKTVWYTIARVLQKLCPFCYMANKLSGKNMQAGICEEQKS